MTTSPSGMGHAGHDHGGMVPSGMTVAKRPTFTVGEPVVITADHMPGMKGAKGTIAGAYTTTTYAVNYTPTTGGPVVRDHKWVVQEEISGAGSAPYPVGAKVTLNAAHMAGMQGAKATVAEVTKQTVYTVNYTPTDGSAMVMNHMWVVENELTKG